LPVIIRIQEDCTPKVAAALDILHNEMKERNLKRNEKRSLRGDSAPHDEMETTIIQALAPLQNTPDFGELISKTNEYLHTIAAAADTNEIPQATHVPECPATSPPINDSSPTTDSSGDTHYPSSLSSPGNTSLTGDSGEPICLGGPRQDFTQVVSRRIGRLVNLLIPHHSFPTTVFYSIGSSHSTVG